MRGRKLLGLLVAGICSVSTMAQISNNGELNARITINSDKIQGTDKSVFTTLQTALTEFVNNRRWTDATFAVNERIDCSMTIILSEQSDLSLIHI